MTAGSVSAPSIIPLRPVERGKGKFSIDTNTQIEIRSDTNDADIYYTLDTNKPDPFSTISIRRSTIHYRKPFRLPDGKQIVKAIAVSNDGKRESAVVTKTFDVSLIDSDHSPTSENENKFLYEIQQERKELIKRIYDENQQMQQSLSESNMNRSSQHDHSWHDYPNNSMEDTPPRVRYNHPNAQSQAGRLQKQTDFLRCAHCFAPRSTDLNSRFCTECGLPWNTLTPLQPRLSKPDSHSLGTCVNCKSTVPFNSEICVVCETPLSPEHQHMLNVKNQAKILCPSCKATNPVNLRTCIICEGKLMPTTSPLVEASVSVPIAPKVSGQMMTCSKCFRLNNIDARFCDWCGAKPEKGDIPLQCTKCRAENDPYAKFCTTCGCVLEPPLRVIDGRLRNDLNLPSGMIAGTLTFQQANPTWLNANATFSRYRQPYLITKTEAATQTFGLYYPSTGELDQIINQNKQLQADREFKERRPILTAISPGKGYWRQQMDHICAHLKTHAVNKPEFRSTIGEPRLGKMVDANVHENEYQVTLEAVFRKPEHLAQSRFYFDDSHNQSHTINTGRSSARSSTFSSAFNSDDEQTKRRRRSKVKRRVKSRSKSAGAVGTGNNVNRSLLKLLSTTKHNKSLDMVDELKQLLKEKADANQRDKDGYTLLQLAVKNRYNECLIPLIKEGHAKLDARGPKGNTALHEACYLENDGVEPLKILLRYGGETTWTNDKKENIFDLALKLNCQELIKVIKSHCGQQIIDRQMKTDNKYYDDHPPNGHRSS